MDSLNELTFLNQLILVPILDGINWRVYDQFDFIDPVLGRRCVEKGFLTDLGSIPRIAQNLVSTTGKGTWGYAVHDRLYAGQEVTREEADQCLRRFLIALRMPVAEADAVYKAVRMFGEIPWDRHAKNNDPQHVRDRQWDLLADMTPIRPFGPFGGLASMAA